MMGHSIMFSMFIQFGDFQSPSSVVDPIVYQSDIQNRGIPYGIQGHIDLSS